MSGSKKHDLLLQDVHPDQLHDNIAAKSTLVNTNTATGLHSLLETSLKNWRYVYSSEKIFSQIHGVLHERSSLMHLGGDYTSSLFNSIRSKKCNAFVFQTPTLNIEYGEGMFFQNQVNRYDKLVDSTKSQLLSDLSSLSTSNNITIMKVSENELINPDDHSWED